MVKAEFKNENNMTEQIEQQKAAQRAKYPNVPEHCLPKMKVKKMLGKNLKQRLLVSNPNHLRLA